MIVECPACHTRYDVSGRPVGTEARCRCGRQFRLPDPPKTARTLDCPKCGAPTPPTDSQCAYCKTALAVVACPRCFGLVFAGNQHCQYCGAGMAAGAIPTVNGEAPARHCPRCERKKAIGLLPNLVGNTLLDICPSCSGMWVDAPALERVLADRAERGELAAILGAAPVVASGTVEPVVYLKCPQCQQLMHRINFGKRSGVIVDVCKAHGSWFDKDELRRIAEFVAQGGLAHSERIEREQTRELQREARRTAILGEGPSFAGPDQRRDGRDVFERALSAIASLLD